MGIMELDGEGKKQNKIHTRKNLCIGLHCNDVGVLG
jgi:hypothetical protein